MIILMNILFVILILFLYFLSFQKINQVFVDQTILSMMIIATIVTGYFAYKIKDMKYIKKHFFSFSVETLLIGFVSFLLFVCIYHLRQNTISMIEYLSFIGISFYFMFIHILFQISGLYNKI
jgi:hypothetical protein